MDNMHLVTGYLGYEHITAVDQGAFNAALIGTGQFVLDKGNVFEVQVISNNSVRVLDGELMMQGRFVRVDPDTYVDLTIENGTQGYYRNDLIVARYAKDTLTGIESVNLVVIKGEASASNPSDPEYTVGDITNGAALQNDFPLWRIPLTGLSVGTPESLFGEPFLDSMRTLPEIRKQVNEIHSEVDKQLAEYDEEMSERISKIEAYTKEEELTDETKAEYGLDASATPDDVFNVIHSQVKENSETITGYYMSEGIRVKPLLSKINHVAAGPMDGDDANYIGSCAGYPSLHYNSTNDVSSYTPSQLYWGLMGGYYPLTSINKHASYLYGRYTYDFTQKQAFKLDHVTRTATLLADLSSYSGTYSSYDRIFAIDNEYIYFAKHLAYNQYSASDCYGTIYKFDHGGNLVSSVTASGTTDWRFSHGTGWTNATYYYPSCFSNAFSNLKKVIHTKNYIALLATDGYTSTSGTYQWFLTLISKSTLKVILAQSKVNLVYTCDMFADYDNDILFYTILPSSSYTSAYFYADQLTGSGRTNLTSSQSSVSFGGSSYSFSSISAIENHAANNYYLLKLYYSSGSGYYYTVLTQDQIVNLASVTSSTVKDSFNINYVTTEALSISIQNYDPVKDDFTTGGVPYQVVPTYVAPVNSKTIADGYAALSFFKIDDHYHFHRTSDNEIYESDASVNTYLVNRVVEVTQ